MSGTARSRRSASVRRASASARTRLRGGRWRTARLAAPSSAGWVGTAVSSEAAGGLVAGAFLAGVAVRVEAFVVDGAFFALDGFLLAVDFLAVVDGLVVVALRVEAFLAVGFLAAGFLPAGAELDDVPDDVVAAVFFAAAVLRGRGVDGWLTSGLRSATRWPPRATAARPGRRRTPRGWCRGSCGRG
ncbi:hypothetical protein GCM10025872_03640 [Barrientosiimonas endolithica]|uniref:Uncharacterized protein n=2 Tax=Barrientosiimonas endolithica TaxID=1535208 RepID=A0ABM8H7A3_9MICO|nr:hypothetical protein GCM10025872_03640 [Barrientosiimonas endolithica]